MDEPVLWRLAIQRRTLAAPFMCATGLAVFECEEAVSATIEATRTTVIFTNVPIDAFYLINCRSLQRSVLAVGLFTNLAVYWGILLVIGLQLAFTYLPVMNTLFYLSDASLSG